MHAALLWVRADFVAAFDETAVLESRNEREFQRGGVFFKKIFKTEWEFQKLSEQEYRFFALGSPRLAQGIMILTNMQPEEMLRGEVSAAFRTSVRVRFGIVDFEVFKC